MKRFAFALALLLTVGASVTYRTFSAAGATGLTAEAVWQDDDKDNRSISALWKAYEMAEDADMPVMQLKILERIKAKAKKKHLLVDFYEAGEEYVEIKSEINWKDWESQLEAFEKELQELREPALLLYHWLDERPKDELAEFVATNKRKLLASRNTDLYGFGGLSRYPFKDILLEKLSNDYEYALWALYARGACADEISDYYKGQNPFEALVEYTPYLLDDGYSKASYEKLAEFADRDSDKAVSVLARWGLLLCEWNRLEAEEATEDVYIDFRNMCGEFIKEAKSFRGGEKLLEYGSSGRPSLRMVVARLDGESIEPLSFFEEDNSIGIYTRNVESVKVAFYDYEKRDRALYEVASDKLEHGYYVRELVKLSLPDMDDGQYYVTCESKSRSVADFYEKFSFSLASREGDAASRAVYAADYYTGEPLRQCTLELLDADLNVLTTADDFSTYGFTPLPESFSHYIDGRKGAFYVRVSSTDANGVRRRSRSMRVDTGRYYDEPSVPTDVSWPRAMILTDRSAFNPDETVQWKAILYKGDYEYDLLPEGTAVKVVLYDSQDKELASEELRTNAFGSVFGSFPLGGESRGGYYRIAVFAGGSMIDAKMFRVDELVLPTFDVEWDKDDRMYMEGDRLRFSGRVKAYSGHSLSGATAVFESVATGEGGKVDIAPDGTFCFETGLPEVTYRRILSVCLKVSDGTGETQEFYDSRQLFASPPLQLQLKNGSSGLFTLADGLTHAEIASYDFARIGFDNSGLTREDLKISYTVSNEGKTVKTGELAPNGELVLELKGMPSGLYTVDAKASVSGRETERSLSFMKIGDDDTSMDAADVTSFFRETDDGDIALQIGCTAGPVWAVVELFGDGNICLDSRMVTLDGIRGGEGSLKTISYTRREGWPETLTLNVLYFLKGKCHRYSRTVELEPENIRLPLSFSRFTDRARPGEDCRIVISTDPDTECAVTIYDKASGRIQPNGWYRVMPMRRPLRTVYYRTLPGANGRLYPTLFSSRSRAVVVDGVVIDESANSDIAVSQMAMKAAAFASAEAADDADAAAGAFDVREDFGATMAWEPALHSDENGAVEMSFKGADRLSAYHVQVFAHGAGMKNAVLSREMEVSIPVKLSIAEPLFLYEGDRYVARAGIASTLDMPVSGKVEISFMDGADYRTAAVLAGTGADVTLLPGGADTFSALIEVPEGLEELGILVRFTSGEATDALFVKVPVLKPFQTITEAHSALLKAGMDREELLAGLRSLFVGSDASALETSSRSIIAMIREALPEKAEPKSSDVLSLTEAYWSNMLIRRLGGAGLDDAAMADLAEKIAACQNDGGGIAWFEGMQSSPIVTAAALQRLDAVKTGTEQSVIDMEKAVKYLDAEFFSASDRPYWCGGISLEVYLQTRALYSYIPFSVSDSKIYKQSKKHIKSYLVPEKARGLNFQILAKARRLHTLQALLSRPGGTELAGKWGITLNNKLIKSLDADVESLLQYAVEHKSGGSYYPNAVMPWRGLLESELYAHALLCELLTGASELRPQASYASRAAETAEGIRLWLMVQKETQHWGTDAACVEAIASVLRGRQETLQTEVLMLSAVSVKPFPEVVASGNGFTVSRSYSIGDRVLADGDTLHVGDKVTARYSVWNEENRSFVRLCAPRPANMRPVQQLSGRYGWGIRPLSPAVWTYTPQGYRNVLKDRTEYWFDSYPEEESSVSEEFFVTQEGRFSTPAVEVESLYAPHYRANDAGRGPVDSK